MLTSRNINTGLSRMVVNILERLAKGEKQRDIESEYNLESGTLDTWTTAMKVVYRKGQEDKPFWKQRRKR